MVLAIVAPVGVDLSGTKSQLQRFFDRAGFEAYWYQLSDCIREYVRRRVRRELPSAPEFVRINGLIDAGNEIRHRLGLSAVADLAVAEINRRRPPVNRNMDGAVHILISLKNPAEIGALREIYGPALYVLGVTASDTERVRFLRRSKKLPETQARRLIERDEREQHKYGQQTRETFHLADFYLRVSASSAVAAQLDRFLRLTFGDPRVSPNQEEHGMFLAYAASVRSASLARQVGAAIVDPRGDLLATGCNDIPSCGGGVMWQDESGTRSTGRQYDANDLEKNRLLLNVMIALSTPHIAEESLTVAEKVALIAKAKLELQATGLLDITEFGTDVHAEMEAILSAARRGVPVRGSTLFTTTFPCHNCAKHIVAAGIGRVVYIEPYPKSRALDLFAQWITLDPDDSESKVKFEPLVGVGPRRFFDLFSLTMGIGIPLKRKDSHGAAVEWREASARMRTPFMPLSYMEREMNAIERLNRLLHSDETDAETEGARG